MKTREKQRQLWIGLAKVEQLNSNGVLGDAEGAFTNAIALAEGRASFRRQVKEALDELDLRLIRLENPERLKNRLTKHSIDPELREVAEAATNNDRVNFGTFHAYDN